MRKWFTIPSLLQLFVTIGLIGFFLIQAGISNSHLMLKELQQQMLRQVSEQLSQRMQTAMRVNEMNYDAFTLGLLDLENQRERERFFTSRLKSYPEIAMSFIGLADGSFYGARRTADGELQIVRNNNETQGASWYYRTSDTGESIELTDIYPNFDPRTRPWYEKALESGEPSFSSVYSHFVFHEPAITASHPVYDESGRLIGVFGVDYLLSWLGDILGSLPIGANGQIFITDEAGMLIATSSGDPSYKMVDGVSQLIPATENGNSLIQASLALPIEQNRNEQSGFKVDGVQYFVSTTSFQEYGANWNIHVISAEDDFLGEVKQATLQTGLILIAALIGSFFITSWIAGRMTKPIVKLSKAAEELSKGRLIQIPDDGRNDELGTLTRSFNAMGLQMTNLVANLEKEVASRTQELEHRNAELQRLSYFDGLTGIANRRQFDYAIARAWNKALRHGRPVALFMLDIDLFGDYNNTYGHQAGDDCLKTIGKLLGNKVRRASDLVARYGGEEFVAILQDTDTSKLAAYAESIRASVENLNIEHSASPYKKVTMSIGVACLVPTIETSPAELIEMADRALYQAKKNGRNKVQYNPDGCLQEMFQLN
jgi:diguanylate cyclase (GGDEF)-like protein